MVVLITSGLSTGDKSKMGSQRYLLWTCSIATGHFSSSTKIKHYVLKVHFDLIKFHRFHCKHFIFGTHEDHQNNPQITHEW